MSIRYQLPFIYALIFNDSSLPQSYKEKLLIWDDQRISDDGVVIIKAQSHRSRAKNKKDAYDRLRELILIATAVQKSEYQPNPAATP